MSWTGTEIIKNRYNRYSKFYDIFELPMETFFSKFRPDLVCYAEGNVLEVGVGTGKNLGYYPDDVHVTAIDLSPGMLSKAKKKFPNKKNITFLEMDIQSTTFEDNVFDTIIGSFVFCSVPDPVKGLNELRRICKPGGKIYLLEHVRSNKKIIGPILDIFNPIPVILFGFNINRNTTNNIKKAGFVNIVEKIYWSDILKIYIITNIK